MRINLFQSFWSGASMVQGRLSESMWGSREVLPRRVALLEKNGVTYP
jgi:hypothetical protein